MLQNQNDNGNRRLFWDESNRLRVVNDNGQVMQHYIYDASGARVLKASSQIESVFENGQIDSSSTTIGLYTTYVSPYMVIDSNQKYSKHYFNGTQRIVSRIGDKEVKIFEENNFKFANQNKLSSKNQEEYSTDFATLKHKQIVDFNYYLSKDKSLGKKSKVTYQEYNKTQPISESSTARVSDVIFEPFPTDPVLAEMFYYHSDHLGTGTFLSDTYGNPYQMYSLNTKIKQN